VTSDGATLTAIGDEGAWFTARLEYDALGRLVGVARAEIGRLHGLDGEPLAVKNAQDAESLARLPDGVWLLGFEHWHRLWAYRGGERPLAGVPTTFTAPPGLEAAPANGGLESLAALPDGRLVAITEELAENGLLVGWVGRDGRWEKLHYRSDGTTAPSDITALPSGDLLVLERGYSPIGGSTIRVRLVPGGQIAAGAVLEGRLLAELRKPLSVDNFEGIAARRNDDGETLVYLISDDNFNPLQRTLLLMFKLDAGPAR
jgi:YD repeat-containing protein